MKNRAILVAVALFLSSGLAAAQDTTPAKSPAKTAAKSDVVTKKFSDWTVQCGTAESVKRCVMGQAIQVQISEKAVLSVALEIGRVGEKQELALIMTAPLGISLPPGIQLKIDAGKVIRAPYRICTKGCVALLPMDSKLIGALKKGKEAKVGIVIGAEKGVALPISLTGFTKAFNYFKAQQK